MKRIVVLGGGESGIGAAVLAKKQGFDVFLSDNGLISQGYRKLLKENHIPFEEGKHTLSSILNADEVIKSPGIPDSTRIIQEITNNNIPIISEIEFAGRYDNSHKICITGTNGKTTTTTIIYTLLKNSGLNVGLAGNIGSSYAYQVATENRDYYVLELSSFQLDGMSDFKANIAVLLNIQPDHLDRYENNLNKYASSKFKITQNMTPNDSFIYCMDDEITSNYLKDLKLEAEVIPFTQKQKVEKGGYTENENLIVKYNDGYSMLQNNLSLKGKHNIYNSLAAAITAKIVNIDNDIIRESLSSIKGVSHRLEDVPSTNGITYINDSKATNVNSTWYALECMQNPVVWIAGGTDKGNDYSILNKLVKDKVKALVCLGKDNSKLHKSFSDKIETIVDASSAEEAVRKATALAKSGEIVLLSPCCASFDLFKNYEDRGDKFKNAVLSL